MTEQSVKCERDNGELSSETALLHGGAGLIVVTSFGVACVRVKRACATSLTRILGALKERTAG